MADTYNMSDVFISYSRRNTEFVHRLFDDLKARDKEVWADFEDIPKAADWWREIQAGIDAADAFVFVITPDSIRSEICRKEIEHAVEVNKRLLPVLHEEIIEDDDKAAMHPAISSHNWIFFRPEDNYDEALQTLLESIETDLEHNRTHSRLLVRAKEWQENNKASAYLLQEEDLEQARNWLTQAYQKTPRPSDLHIQYIEASREAESARQRRLLTLVSAGLVIAIALALFAGYQTILADRSRQDAVAARQVAEDNADKARSLALAASSSQALDDNNPDLAISLAAEAINIDSSQPQVYTALADAVYSPGTRAVINPGFKLIFALTYAPDGETFAVGFETGEVCLRDARSGEAVRCLTLSDSVIPHEYETAMLTYSDDGNYLMSMSDDAIHIWNMRQGGAVEQSFYASDNPSNTLFGSGDLSSNGTQLLIGYKNGDVALYNLESPDDPVHVFENLHDDTAVSEIIFSPDDSHALTGDADGVIKYLELSNTPLVLSTLKQHQETILSLDFIPDTSLALSGANDDVIHLWNLQQSRSTLVFEGHDSGITDILINPQNETFFSSSWDNSIREWDFISGRQIRAYYGHSGGINAMTLSPDGEQLVSGGYDTALRLWNVNSFVKQQRLTPPVRSTVSATAYGETAFIAGFENGTVIAFDRESTDVIINAEAPVPANSDDSTPGVMDIILLPDNNRYLTLYEDNTVIARELNAANQDSLWELSHVDSIDSLIADGNEQLTPGAVEGLRMTAHADGGEWLLIDEFSGIFRYSADDGTFIARVPYSTPADFLTAAYHPDGESLIVGLNDRIFNLHQVNIETGEIMQTFDGHGDGILAIDFNPEETQMVTGAFDNRMIVWDINTGEIIRQFEGHSDRVSSVAINPFNSQQVASASNDRTMKLWDLETGFEIFTYEGHTERVIDVHFSVDGESILTASTDNSLILWRQPQQLDALLSWMRENRHVRDLTCLEREQYLGTENACDIESTSEDVPNI